MSILTFSQATQVASVSRSTIYRYAQEGRISVVRLPNGKRGIDVTELERVFGPLKKLEPSQNIPEKQVRTTKTQADIFQERDKVVELLHKQVELLERELTSAKEEKARLLGLLEQRLLESQKSKHRKGKKRGH